MANNNKKKRPQANRFSIGRTKATPERTDNPKRGAGKGIEGIDRAKIDSMAEDERDAELFVEVWDC